MKFFMSLLLLVTVSFTYSQSAPQKLNYQAVARNSSGVTLNNQTIGVKAEIVNQNNVLYAERHLVTTNQFGLFTLQVGGGTVISGGSFKNINWGAVVDTQGIFIRTSIDLTGGSNYVLMGQSQLLSVPYALYAANNKYLKVNENKGNLNVGYGGNNVDSGGYNIAIGINSLKNNRDNYNIAIGNSSLLNNTSGNSNMAIGTLSLEHNTTGGENTAIGEQSLFSNTTGCANTAIANHSLFQNTTGWFNTAIGYAAGSGLKDGYNNVFIGYGAGSDTTFKSVNNKLVIGSGNTPLIYGDFANKTIRFNAMVDSLRILNRIHFDDENANSHIARYDTGYSNPIMYGRYFYGHYGDLIIQGQSKVYTGNIHFVTGSNLVGAQPPTQRMVIMDNGKVGIGDCLSTPPRSKLEVKNGDVYLSDATKGIILTSPNGNCWRVTVDNSGNLVRTSIPCPTY
jgi:hypothetical protein